MIYWLDNWFTLSLVFIGMAISLASSAYVNSTFKKYDKIKSQHHVTGTDAAEYILQNQHIHNVGVQSISGELTDNYNSGNKMLSLSQSTARSTSVAAIGVAAHECGHAVQDAVDYKPMRIRAAIVPAANLGSSISIPMIMFGLIFSFPLLINLGIVAFSIAFLFQIVTLPVEFDASRRALKILGEGGLLTQEELPMARKVLFAAALTYVAAAITTLLQLIRLIMIANNRRN
ncbi:MULTISPECIES: zinc metallopeptidase [Enterococcus]|uniref:Zn-dependent protease n=1 Tax=Enterococcus sulfureus ATCC 49903 TaxID=1140003 RepID=S0KKZ2_9ENTE|nr:zinc metallopeptidase [Enterococcus sulfureus]EOT45499.1 Zn-dependent protease [Enterococcus sulfureus ATCC 49903]EOT83390.1 Zn-dependent protease [Enterococcus sulfureus ATCC 49903]